MLSPSIWANLCAVVWNCINFVKSSFRFLSPTTPDRSSWLNSGKLAYGIGSAKVAVIHSILLANTPPRHHHDPPSANAGPAGPVAYYTVSILKDDDLNVVQIKLERPASQSQSRGRIISQ